MMQFNSNVPCLNSSHDNSDAELVVDLDGFVKLLSLQDIIHWLRWLGIGE